MGDSQLQDPAERRRIMRLFYRGWRPTRLGRWANRVAAWLNNIGVGPSFQVTMEVRGAKSGKVRKVPVVIATVNGADHLVSMLGPKSDWVRNVEAAEGNVVLRRRKRRSVHLVALPVEERAPVLREYVRIATSGRTHFPVAVGAPLTEFEAIAERYPVYRIDPA